MTSLPTMIELTLRCFLARSTAARTSRSLRVGPSSPAVGAFSPHLSSRSLARAFSFSLSPGFCSVAPTATRKSNSMATPGTSSPPQVDAYVRIARVSGEMTLRSDRICDAVTLSARSGWVDPWYGEYETLASGASIFGALDSYRSRVHNPACTQTPNATTPAARRIERPDGAEMLGPEPVPWARPRLRYTAFLGNGHAQIVTAHGGLKAVH